MNFEELDKRIGDLCLDLDEGAWSAREELIYILNQLQEREERIRRRLAKELRGVHIADGSDSIGGR